MRLECAQTWQGSLPKAGLREEAVMALLVAEGSLSVSQKKGKEDTHSYVTLFKKVSVKG